MVPSAVQLKRVLLGDRPRVLALLLVPTLLALAVDLALRGGILLGYAPQGKAIYGSSLLVSAAFWGLPLWGAAWLWARSTREPPGRRRLAARAALVVFFGGWVLPLATCSYAGQIIYHRLVHAYVGRDTVRLGFALRGTVRDWFTAWGSSTAAVGIVVGGLIVTLVIMLVVRRAAPHINGRPPLLLAVTFVAALVVFWFDLVDSRFLQAATPDDCFVHGVVHAVRVGVTGRGRTRRGVSLRTPVAASAAQAISSHRPNVVLVILESVRADGICSDPPPKCQARFLDDVAADRIALGKLTTTSPGTFGSCVFLWTGLPATASVSAAHSAPVLWEYAHAAGYRTSYITSQNLQFENFGAFVQIAGIDVLEGATDLGGLRQEQLGAPDERATEETLRFVRAVSGGTPYFSVLHLSNTHAPYRVDPELQPFAPHTADPLGNVGALHNHYRNSVLLQERTIAAFLRELRALPSWEDTAVFVVSDHGEQFGERGGLYHLHSLYDEELRIPGFVVSGARALDERHREALRSYDGRRTYLADVNATLVDLLGMGAARAASVHANPQARSLFQKYAIVGDSTSVMATATAVWDTDILRQGVMRGDRLLVRAAGAPWRCFLIAQDAEERTPLPPERCGSELQAAALGLPPP